MALVVICVIGLGMTGVSAGDGVSFVVDTNESTPFNQTLQPEYRNEGPNGTEIGADNSAVLNPDPAIGGIDPDKDTPGIPPADPDTSRFLTEPDPMYVYFPDLKPGDALPEQIDKNLMEIKTDSLRYSIRWQKAYGGSESEDAITGYTRPTSDGGFIATVTTFSDDGDLSGKVLHGWPLPCIWIVKLDNSGSIQWQTAPLYSRSRDIRQVSDGGYVAVGYFYNEYDYYDTKKHKVTVIKLDRTGNILWTHTLGWIDQHRPSSIKQTPDGGYVVSGYANRASIDGWIMKLSSTGDIEWEQYYGGSSNDFAEDLVVTRDGGYIVSGSSESTDTSSNGNHGGADAWVLKLDSSGNIQWQKCYGGSGNDLARHIEELPEGGFIVAGITASNDGDVSGLHNAVGGSDVWVIRLDETGSILWQRTLGGTRGEYAVDVRQDHDGGFVVAAGTESNDGEVSGNHGSRDVWVVKLDSTGKPLWQLCLGGSGEENPGSILLTGDGDYVTASATLSNDGDVSGNHGNYDLWIVKHGEGMPINPPELIVDATDSASSALIPGATISLFDVNHGEWQNETAGTGSYTFTSSGSSQQYALAVGTAYRLAASAEGYSPAVRDITFGQDGQRETVGLAKVEDEPEAYTFSITNVEDYPGNRNLAPYGGAASWNVYYYLKKKAGWTLVSWKNDTAVTKEDLGTLGDGLNNATFHFHFSHGGHEPLLNGSPTLLELSNGVFVHPLEVQKKWGKNNKWVMLEACEVLDDVTWGGALDTSHGIFGYKTEVGTHSSVYMLNDFFDNAMNQNKTLVESYINATKYGAQYSDIKNVRAAVIFNNKRQALGDHLPDYGTVEPDGSPDEKPWGTEWPC